MRLTGVIGMNFYFEVTGWGAVISGFIKRYGGNIRFGGNKTLGEAVISPGNSANGVARGILLILINIDGGTC